MNKLDQLAARRSAGALWTGALVLLTALAAVIWVGAGLGSPPPDHATTLGVALGAAPDTAQPVAPGNESAVATPDDDQAPEPQPPTF